jgi:nucleoside-triphosphatase THEP1
MELVSNRFLEVVEIALDGGKPLLATIPSEGPAFVEEIKGRNDVRLFALTQANRDELLEDVVKLLQG